MKKILMCLFAVCCSEYLRAQELPTAIEQQLENRAASGESETADDAYLQRWAAGKKNKLNINTASKEELRELDMLTDLQIDNLIVYRRLLGVIIDIYELQAIPAWDVLTIRHLLPFITIAMPVDMKEEMSKRLKNGDHSLLLRVSQTLGKTDDSLPPGMQYAGSQQKIFFRYRYSYKNLLQYGITGDKDAGEQFFRGGQKQGFDFYSFHVWIKKIGIIQSLVMGDFTVNMGQGLMQWQSLAFKKSTMVMGIERQSATLRPYTSAGEFSFHRGAGITLRKGKMEATLFISLRQLSASIVTDTINRKKYFSSFQTSGYHRTDKEMEDKNDLRQFAVGTVWKYAAANWHLAMNAVYYQFSASLQKRSEPYNLFALNGDRWYNAGADYSYTYRNLHLFGEWAVDRDFHTAVLNGAVLSVDPTVDLSLLHRSITKEYQSIEGNAFTENSMPTNENGFYIGIAIHPSAGWRLDAYADLYRFPWLKYQVDAPGPGKDFLIQLTYTPNRQVELYARFHNECKEASQQNWRVQLNYTINSVLRFRSRMEAAWYNDKETDSEEGFLLYADLLYKPVRNRLSVTARLQYFETDGYNSRLYAYENDVLNNYTVPSFYGRGYRYYFILNYDLNKKISFWLRWAQTIESQLTTELKIQSRVLF